MRVSCMFAASCVYPSDIAEDRPTQVGMAGLRHKQRHNPLEPETECSTGRVAKEQKPPVSDCWPSALPWGIAATVKALERSANFALAARENRECNIALTAGRVPAGWQHRVSGNDRHTLGCHSPRHS
jgi:hypothetical protein